MHNQEDLRQYLTLAQSQLDQARRFEDEIRHLSLVLYNLEGRDTNTSSTQQLINILSRWLQSFLIIQYDTSELIAQHTSHLRQLLNRQITEDTEQQL